MHGEKIPVRMRLRASGGKLVADSVHLPGLLPTFSPPEFCTGGRCSRRHLLPTFLSQLSATGGRPQAIRKLQKETSCSTERMTQTGDATRATVCEKNPRAALRIIRRHTSCLVELVTNSRNDASTNDVGPFVSQF